MPSSKITTPFVVRLAMILVILIAIVYIAILGKKILAPLFLAFLFALLILPIASVLEIRLKLPRAAAALFSVILLISFLALVFYSIGSQLAALVQDWPSFKEQFHGSLNNLQNWLATHLHVDVQKQKNYINNEASKVLSSNRALVGSTLLSLTSIIFFFSLSTIFTFFLLLYRKLLLGFIIAVFPEKSSGLIYDIVETVQSIIRRYIIGLLLEMLIVATLACVSFLIFGVKYALLFGLIAAVLNVVPYAGIFTALLISSFVTFAVEGSAGRVLVVILTIFGVHLIDSNILLPFVVGSKIRINGMVTVLGIIVGEMIWGIPGMFFSVPFIAITKIIFDRIEPLRPWGLLLGHEKGEEEAKKVKSNSV